PGSRRSNSTYYDPSVAAAIFPFAGQNQSFCPVNEQAVSHGYLPPLSLQEPQADANNRLNRAIQLKVLLAYIQYKNSAAFSGNDAPAYFANYLHSTVCCRYVCRCTKFFSLASHYNGCHDARCDICNTVRYNAVVDTFHPDFEHVKGGLLRVTGSGDFGQPRYGSSEAMQPLPKRLKLENTTAPTFRYHGICQNLLYLIIFEMGVELLPKLLDGSTIANRMGANMEVFAELLPYLREDSTSAKEMGKTMEMNIELLPKLIEDSTSPKEMGRNMEEWRIELISKRIEDSPSAKEIDMNMEKENVELMSKLTEDSSNAKEMGKDVAESLPGPPEVAIAGYKVADNARGHFNNLI
ncbi:hypothetical protein Gotur_000644, partial [Gossypium turneri]